MPGRCPAPVPKRKPALARLAGWRIAVLGFLSGTTCGALLSNRAWALDFDINDGLITETVAGRNLQRFYDNSKRFGAERVVDRNRSEYDPPGLRMGNYVILPSVGAIVSFDNNIYGSHANRQSDIRTELTPNIVFKSDLPRHVLDLSLGGRIVDYVDHPDQNYVSGYAEARGALHFDAAHTMSADVLSELQQEERQDTSASRLAAGPLAVWHNRASLGITRDVGRLYGTLSSTVESWKFGNVEATTGGVLDQSFRDTDVYSGQMKGGYRISPGFEVVGRARVLRIENTGNGKISRSGMGYESVVGLSMESSPLLRWKLLGGWGYRGYDEAGLANVQSFLAEGQVQWLVTQKMTLYGTLSRSISDEVTATGGGMVQSAVEARLEYDLWHNLVINATASAALGEAQGISRTDHIYTAGFGAEYWANRNWLFTFRYEHQIRDSTDESYSMSRDKVSIGAKLQF